MAGDVPTFVTHQIFYEKKIPYTMLNINNFEKIIKSYGFKLTYKSKFKALILEQDQHIPNWNLPSSHRIGRSVNLVFSRA